MCIIITDYKYYTNISIYFFKLKILTTTTKIIKYLLLLKLFATYVKIDYFILYLL
jgi:hypothetical protein